MNRKIILGILSVIIVTCVVAILQINSAVYSGSLNSDSSISDLDDSKITPLGEWSESTFTNYKQGSGEITVGHPVIIEIPKNVGRAGEFLFEPITVVMGVNNTVLWKNNDDVPHFIELYYLAQGTPTILPGETNGLIFYEPGIYEYHDEPWIKGRINVIGG